MPLGQSPVITSYSIHYTKLYEGVDGDGQVQLAVYRDGLLDEDLPDAVGRAERAAQQLGAVGARLVAGLHQPDEAGLAASYNFV